MYVLDVYHVDLAVQHALIERHPFALVTTSLGGEQYGVHVPFVLHRDLGPKGTLRAHMARANPLAAALPEEPAVLVAFTGPHAYICPDDYATGKPFPTWSYAVVHVHGRIRQLPDAALRQQLEDLIASQERALGRPEPWTLARAPQEAFDGYFPQIVGFELTIEKTEGYFKLHQRNEWIDAEAQIHALRRRGSDTAARLADLIEAHNAHRRPPGSDGDRGGGDGAEGGAR